MPLNFQNLYGSKLEGLLGITDFFFFRVFGFWFFEGDGRKFWEVLEKILSRGVKMIERN